MSRLAAAVLCVFVVGVSPAAAQTVLGADGRQGAVTIWQANCKYRVFGSQGVLQVEVQAPTVSGANTRRGTRKERTYVRYQVFVSDAYSGTTLTASSWSGFLRVRESGKVTWPGSTSFDMAWWGGYGAEILVEWWNAHRLLGWRTFRTDSFMFFDSNNTGPFGPLSYCYKYTVHP